jgi:ATP-dependent Clp protease ATP-binding subunit ClpC
MAVVTYSPITSRARLAKLNARLKPALVTIVEFCAVLALSSGLLLIPHHSSLGLIMLGLALGFLSFERWVRWQVRVLPVDPESWAAKPVPLDQVASADLVAGLSASDAPHLWRLALSTWQGIFVANHLELPVDQLAQLLTTENLSPDGLWGQALDLRAKTKASSLHGGVLIGALLMASPNLQPALKQLKLSETEILSCVSWANQLERMIASTKKHRSSGGIGRDWASGYTPTLKRFGQNMSHRLEDGYAPYIPASRDVTVESLIQHLSGARGAAVVLGGPGSGKTLSVYALADRLIHAQDAGNLSYSQIVALDAAMLIAAGGSIEATLLELFAEAAHAGNIVLFFDDAELFFSEGVGSVDISQVLLPILQQSSLRIIMAMNPNAWQGLVAKSPAFTSLVTPITLKELSDDEVLSVLQEASISLEAKSRSIITLNALQESVKLGERYLADEALPGKAIKLLEDATHYPVTQGLVTAVSVQRAVESQTGTKVATASAQEGSQLLDLENQIHRQMINQDRAVSVVSNALRRARSGVGDPKRPVGSFLFLGPTGVGKTELAKALANVYFGGIEHMIRLDMSEYQQPEDASRLLESQSASQSGDALVSAVRRQPFSLVLLDEIEKAHPDVLNLLLQMLDEGQMTDSSGRKVSFKDTIIIATSNAAADDIRRHIEAGEDLASFESEIVDQIIESHQFRQELLNRFDEIVLFRPLDKKELIQVVGLLLADVNLTLKEQGVQIKVTASAQQKLVDMGYDPRFGARPMRRVIQRTVEDVVAKRLLSGQAQAGQTIALDVADLTAAPTQASSQPN